MHHSFENIKFSVMKRLVFLVGMCTFCFAIKSSEAQVILQPKQVEEKSRGIVYKTERTGGAILNGQGIAFDYSWGKLPTYYRTNYYTVQLGFTRDPREQKQNNNFALSVFRSSRSFVFAKQNNVINLRAGVGHKKYLSEKARRKGVSVGYNLEIGPSIALIKPYYLDLIFFDDENSREFDIRPVRFSEETADIFLNENDIYGSSSFFRGFNEISVIPGIQAKAGMHFSLGAFDKYVKSFEVGVMGDLFINKLPILVESENISNKPFLLNLYLRAEIGVRKN